MSEPIRLVVWDLDETFWKGTLTEGDINYSKITHNIVIELCSRGIMNSICSKNDLSTVRGILQQHGIWDYFIFPSINWEPKGQRIVSLVDTVQLRPESVMLIDDNPMNLNEARFYLPNLQIATQEIIPDILSCPAFDGKKDASLSRLKQYKLLEQRKTDEISAGGSNVEFLRSCNVHMSIEYNVHDHLDRAIELINRTNQLNFTKRRLPEEAEEARAELRQLLSRFDIQAGLVRVQDNYGDYGFVGFFAIVQGTPSKRLLHYCFSCRTLHMGVESFLYDKLGRPELTIVGEVLSDPINDPRVDWIALVKRRDLSVAQPQLSKVPGIYLRGGCDMNILDHYSRMISDDVRGEYNLVRDGIDIRIDHSIIARYAIEGINPDAVRAFRELGYTDDDFDSKLLRERPSGAWMLSFTPDFWVPLYRHKATGVSIPFVCLDAKDPTAIPAGERSARIKNKALLPAIDALSRDYEFQGLVDEHEMKRSLLSVLKQIPSNSPIFLILNKEFHGQYDIVKAAALPTINVNRGSREVAALFPNATVVPMADFISGPADISPNNNHFDRMVYFKLFNHIKESFHTRVSAQGVA